MKVFFYGNIYIGILAGGLVWANSLLFNSIDINVIFLMFFSATMVYNIDRILFYHSDEKNNPERTLYIRQNYELIWFVILVCSAGLFSIVDKIKITILGSGLLLALLTGLYFYIYNRSGKIFTAWITGLLKPGLLGFVWASATVILPVFVNPAFFKSPLLYLVFFIRFSEYFINGFLFDFRDKAGDRSIKFRNIFNVWPENKIIVFLILISLLVMIFVAILIFMRLIDILFLSDAVVLLFYMTILLNLLFKKIRLLNNLTKNKMTYAVIIDSVLFLPVIFTFFKYVVY